MGLLILDKFSEQWLLSRGKHVNKVLEEVALHDPSYLQWMFRTPALGFSKEEFHHLEDVMQKYGISFEKPKRRVKRRKLNKERK